MTSLAKPARAIVFALGATLALAGSTPALSRGVTTVMNEAGIEENSLTYFKVLSSLNIRPFITPAETGVGDAYQVCKRRWLASPYGTWEKFTTVAEVKSLMSSGDSKMEKSAVVKETVTSVGDNAFTMTITVTTPEGESEDTKLDISRNDYIVTCLDSIEKQQKLDKLLKIRYEHEEPYLEPFTIEGQEYRLIVNSVSIKGNFPEGGTFQEENTTGVAHFWAYSKGLNNTEASIVTDKNGTIQGIMQLQTKVTYAYTDD